MYNDFKNKINDKTITAGVIGLGYVGLPLVHAMCTNGLKVTGFDIDPTKAEKLHNGESYLETVKGEDITAHIDAEKFEATTDFSRLNEPDVLLICVPTPLDENRDPDLSYVENTVADVFKTLRKGQMVVLESTTYPGTSSGVIQPVLEAGGLKSGEDFYLVYSPEREDPGNKNFEMSTTPKVVGADGEQALELACAFYDLFVAKTVPVKDLETAEAVKITENVFRAVNIALVNELKLIYGKMGIDVWDVIEAAKTKPFGYMPFYPGPGLGGHCIPIDPFYLTWRAREFGCATRFIELAGEINTNMPAHVVEQTAKALQEKQGKTLKDSKVMIAGVAYKKNINDQRESPAFPIMKLLMEQGAQVDYNDPHIPEIQPMRHFPQMAGKTSAEGNWADYDAVLIITDHDALPYDDILKNSRLVVDTRNALKPSQNVVKA